MTKQQIAAAYIKAAEKAIKESEGMNWRSFYVFLSDNELQRGLCWFSICKLGHKISGEIIRPYIKYGPYWYKAPVDCWRIPEMIECLQYRINILKTWL